MEEMGEVKTVEAFQICWNHRQIKNTEGRGSILFSESKAKERVAQLSGAYPAWNYRAERILIPSSGELVKRR
jgi:hypothetical protein